MFGGFPPRQPRRPRRLRRISPQAAAAIQALRAKTISHFPGSEPLHPLSALTDPEKSLLMSNLMTLLSYQCNSTAEGPILDYIESTLRSIELVSIVYRQDSFGVVAVFDGSSRWQPRRRGVLGDDDEDEAIELFRDAILLDAHVDLACSQPVIEPTFISNEEKQSEESRGEEEAESESESDPTSSSSSGVVRIGHSEFPNQILKATGIDNRVSAAALLTLLVSLNTHLVQGGGGGIEEEERESPSDLLWYTRPIVALFSTQEEIGCRGAREFAEVVDVDLLFGTQVREIFIVDVIPGWICEKTEEAAERRRTTGSNGIRAVLEEYPQNPGFLGLGSGENPIIPRLGKGICEFDQPQIDGDYSLYSRMSNGRSFARSLRFGKVPIRGLGVPCIALHSRVSFCHYGDCLRLLEVLKHVTLTSRDVDWPYSDPAKKAND